VAISVRLRWCGSAHVFALAHFPSITNGSDSLPIASFGAPSIRYGAVFAAGSHRAALTIARITEQTIGGGRAGPKAVYP
jgi:hypothetical protein